MKAEATKLLSFLRHSGIKVYPVYFEQLIDWENKSSKGKLDTIFFDAEDMWLDSKIENIIRFDWKSSNINIDHEYLKSQYGLTQKDIEAMTQGDIEKILYDESDYLDRTSMTNDILYSVYQKFLKEDPR